MDVMAIFIVKARCASKVVSMSVTFKNQCIVRAEFMVIASPYRSAGGTAGVGFARRKLPPLRTGYNFRSSCCFKGRELALSLDNGRTRRLVYSTYPEEVPRRSS